MEKGLRISICLTILLYAFVSLEGKDYEFRQGGELRFTAGLLPIDYPTIIGISSGSRPFLGFDMFIDNVNTPGNFGGYPSSIEGFFKDNEYMGPTYISGAYSFLYSYRFRKWFELSAALVYSGCYSSAYDKFSGEYMAPVSYHSISVMPIARFVWLNRKYIRMYSSIGLGMSVVYSEYHSALKVHAAAMINPIGMTVGDRIYGILELSLGTTGLVTAGIGFKL